MKTLLNAQDVEALEIASTEITGNAQDMATIRTLPLAKATAQTIADTKALATFNIICDDVPDESEQAQILDNIKSAERAEFLAATMFKNYGYRASFGTHAQLYKDCLQVVTDEQATEEEKERATRLYFRACYSIQDAHAASAKIGHAVPFYSTGLIHAKAELLKRKEWTDRADDVAEMTLLDIIPTMSDVTKKGMTLEGFKFGVKVGTDKAPTAFKAYQIAKEQEQQRALLQAEILVRTLDSLRAVNGTPIDSIEQFEKHLTAYKAAKEQAATLNADAMKLAQDMKEKALKAVLDCPALLSLEQAETSKDAQSIIEKMRLLDMDTAEDALTVWEQPHREKLAELIAQDETAENQREQAEIFEILGLTEQAEIARKRAAKIEEAAKRAEINAQAAAKAEAEAERIKAEAEATHAAMLHAKAEAEKAKAEAEATRKKLLEQNSSNKPADAPATATALDLEKAAAAIKAAAKAGTLPAGIRDSLLAVLHDTATTTAAKRRAAK